MANLPDDHYRLCVVRAAPVGELRAILDRLISALGFTFFGLTTAYDTVPVKNKETDNLLPFLESAALSYPFGSKPHDPTHELRFFNEGGAVDLHLTWGGQPGFVAELRLGRDAAPSPKGRGLLKLLDLLVQAFHPDFGFIELPRAANVPERPGEVVFGWATYLSKRWPRVTGVPAPGVSIEAPDGGTLLLATRDVQDEFSSDVARHVEGMEKFARPLLSSGTQR